MAPLISMVFSDHGVEDAFRHVLPFDRYFRFQAKPAHFRNALDDASPDNVRALRSLAEQIIRDRAEELRNLARELALERSADCPPRIAARAAAGGPDER